MKKILKEKLEFEGVDGPATHHLVAPRHVLKEV